MAKAEVGTTPVMWQLAVQVAKFGAAALPCSLHPFRSVLHHLCLIFFSPTCIVPSRQDANCLDPSDGYSGNSGCQRCGLLPAFILIAGLELTLPD